MDDLFVITLEKIIHQRKREMPEGSYTTRLFQKGVDKILQKVGEESVEFILDAKNLRENNYPDSQNRAVSEAADLIYHLTVAFAEIGITWEDVSRELQRRHVQ